MFDTTIHLGDLLVAAGFAAGGWRIGVAFRDEMRSLRQTVYGSIEPPVEGLVQIAKRHEGLLTAYVRPGRGNGSVIALALCAGLTVSCGGALKGGTIGGPAPLAAPRYRAVAVQIFDERARPIPGVACGLDGLTDHGSISNLDGYIAWGIVPASVRQVRLVCNGGGYLPFAETRTLATDQNEDLAPVTLLRQHVDASVIPLSALAAIRGAMWPRASICDSPPLLPFGNRPGQPDNIIATTYFDNYTPQQQEDIARCLKSVGLTHVVVGGLVDWWAYHGQYSGHDYSTDEGFERFLDLHQWFWDHGLSPVTFIHQDGATLTDTQAMMRRLVAGHPRAQQLIRIVVMPGWEPAKYEWSSCTWAGYVALGRELFPNALNLIHTVSDVDAPVGTDALCNDDDHVWNPRGNGAGWERVIAAGLHGWLIQNGPYPGAPDGSRQTAEFAAQFKPDGDGATYHSAAWHFAGNAGWPTFSAWGPGIPICLYNAEATAYEAYWSNRPSEADRAAWGNLAVTSGACGALDGISIPVPVRR